MIIYLPQYTSLLLFRSKLIFIGKYGKASLPTLGISSNQYKLFILKNKIIVKQKFINTLVTLEFVNLFRLFSKVKTKLQSIISFYERQISLIGTGFRIWVRILKDKKILLVRVGLSKDVLVKIPDNVVVFPIRQNIIRLLGLELGELVQFCMLISDLKNCDFYKGKGIQYENNSILFKSGKKN